MGKANLSGGAFSGEKRRFATTLQEVYNLQTLIIMLSENIHPMNALSQSLIEICEHNEPDYKPLVDFESWRVALLNYTADYLPEKINRMQRHNETDEVFVLLAGRCILFLGEGEESVTQVHAVDMELYKLYNIKQGVWHSHTFSEDARVLVVENRDTVYENSPFVNLSGAQQKEVVALAKDLWK